MKSATATARSPQIQLRITSPSGAVSTVDLGQKALSLGRAVDNDLAYPDDPALSRRHVCIDPVDHGWAIRDCGSRNGTVLNDVPLNATRQLQVGDRISVGNLTIDVAFRPNDPVQRPNQTTERGNTISTTLSEVLSQTGYMAPPTGTSPMVGSRRVVTALIRAGQELAGHRPLSELFDVILDLALSAVDAKRGVILTGEPNALAIRATRGDGFSLSRAVRDEVLNNKTSLIISDAQFDAAFREQKSIVAQRIRSVMAVPLQTADRVIGLIYVDSGSIVHPFSREDLDLLTVMANVAAIRIEHARLAIVEQQERLMQSELDQACEIQRNLLPLEAPVVPGCELAGFNLPCRAVGGDYYDYLPYSDGRMGLFVGDVCGKGLPAALMMCSLQARVQMAVENNPDAATVLTTLNHNLASRFPMGRFITAFFGVLQPQTGILSYANAGHNYPLILRTNGEMEELRGGNLVLGLFPDVRYDLQRAQLNSGDLLALFSDGVTEAAQSTGEQFGDARLGQFLRENVGLPCSEIVAKLRDHVRQWSGSSSFADDFTILLVRRK